MNEKISINELTNFYINKIIEKLVNAESEYDNDIDNLYTKIYEDLYDLTENFEDENGNYASYVERNIRPRLYSVYYNCFKELYDSFMGSRRIHRGTLEKKDGKVVNRILPLDKSYVVRPKFDFLQYPQEDICDFLDILLRAIEEAEPRKEESVRDNKDKISIEGKIDNTIKKLYPPKSAGKIKKFINEEIHLGKNNEVIYQVLENDPSGEKYIWLEVLKLFYNNTYKDLRTDLWQCAVGVVNIVSKQKFVKIYPALLNSLMYNLYSFDLNTKRNIIDRLSGVIIQPEYLSNIQTYCLFWNLSIWALVEGFQQSLLHNEDYYGEERIQELEKRLESIRIEIENQYEKADVNRSCKIYRGYYVYNYVQYIVYNPYEWERQIWGEFLKKRTSSKLKYNPLPIENCNASVLQIDFSIKLTSEELSILQEDFHGNTPKCQSRSFKERLDKCLSFIKVYGKEAGRKWNTDNPDIKLVRAVYRMFYVHNLMFERKSACTWAKELQAFLENKEPFVHLTREPYNKTQLLKIEGRTREEAKLLECHYVIGSMISKELMEEEKNGELINDIKYKIWDSINRIALLTFHIFCPGADDNNCEDSFKNTRKIFEKIFDAICLSIYKCDIQNLDIYELYKPYWK